MKLSILILAAVLALSGAAAVADIDDARNFYKFDDRVLTSGQPSARQLSEISEDGIEIVINLVPKSERIYNPDERSILARQGVEYQGRGVFAD